MAEKKIIPMAAPADFSRGRRFDNVSYRAFTFRERVLILLGFNVVVTSKFVSQHSPGCVAAGSVVQLTKYSLQQMKEDPSLMEPAPVAIDNEKKTAEEIRAEG